MACPLLLQVDRCWQVSDRLLSSWVYRDTRDPSTRTGGWHQKGRARTCLTPRSVCGPPADLNKTPLFCRPPVQVITSGALIMELAAVFVLGATIITYDYFSSKDSMSSIGYF